MASHAQIESWWAGYRCHGPHTSLNILGRYPVRVQPLLAPATLAMEQALLATGYRNPTGPTGSYNCRTIGGSDTWSLHAYAVAIDLDYGKNPYLRGVDIQPGFDTDPRWMLTEQQVDAIEGIHNANGDSIWRWLGWTIGDTMHFQVDVGPDDCQPVSQPGEIFVYTTWANGMFDNYSDQDIDDLTDAGLISPPSSYWKTMRDNTNRSASQQQEVARFIQAAVVSAQVNTALP